SSSTVEPRGPSRTGFASKPPTSSRQGPCQLGAALQSNFSLFVETLLGFPAVAAAARRVNVFRTDNPLADGAAHSGGPSGAGVARHGPETLKCPLCVSPEPIVQQGLGGAFTALFAQALRAFTHLPPTVVAPPAPLVGVPRGAALCPCLYPR